MIGGALGAVCCYLFTERAAFPFLRDTIPAYWANLVPTGELDGRPSPLVCVRGDDIPHNDVVHVCISTCEQPAVNQKKW
jgi:hypothetical protein